MKFSECRLETNVITQQRSELTFLIIQWLSLEVVSKIVIKMEWRKFFMYKNIGSMFSYPPNFLYDESWLSVEFCRVVDIEWEAVWYSYQFIFF